jgi:hypothetical protein
MKKVHICCSLCGWKALKKWQKIYFFCPRDIFEELIETAMMNVLGHPLGKAISRLYGEQ